MWRALKHGTWVTAYRIRAYSFIMIGFVIAAVIGLLITSSGLIDAWGRPLGTDFANVWTAGILVLNDAAQSAYDPRLHHGIQQDHFGGDTPFYGWHYPPFFLLVAALLALFPYGFALAMWCGVTLAVYLKAARAIVPPHGSPQIALLALVAFPGVMVNVLHGQNGFLSAALLGGGLYFLDKRPVLAGGLFGLLAYKPQFGILIPIVLLATRRWAVFVSATVTILILSLMATVVLGPEIWQAFYKSTHFTRTVVLETGAMGWAKQQSVFAAARALGVQAVPAYALQGILALCVMTAVVWVWRSHVDYALKAAVLAVGALLVTPYVMDYDMMVLAIAGAWLVQHGYKSGFHDGEKTALVFVWALPLFARVVAHVTLVPIGLMGMLGLFGIILWRCKNDARGFIDS